MGTTYELRQQVKTVKANRLEVVESWQEGGERIARIWFEDMKEAHPDVYFELVKVFHSEECLAFTPFR